MNFQANKNRTAPALPTASELYANFSRLWFQQMYLTQAYCTSCCLQLPNQTALEKRLPQCGSELAAALRTYYPKLSARFGQLLSEHSSLLVKFFEALRHSAPDNMDLANRLRERCYLNAEELAAYLAGMNLHWSKQQWRSLFYDYLKSLELVAVEQLNGRYISAISETDTMSFTVSQIAKMMSDGIARQFYLSN